MPQRTGNQIDKAKGLIVKPFPDYWTNWTNPTKVQRRYFLWLFLFRSLAGIVSNTYTEVLALYINLLTVMKMLLLASPIILKERITK